jgi:hypothetical protein
MEDVGVFYDHLVYLTAIRYILWTFGLSYSHLMYFMTILVYFVAIRYIFPRFGILCQEKSGNPAPGSFIGSFFQTTRILLNLHLCT